MIGKNERQQALAGVAASFIGALFAWIITHILGPAYAQTGAALPAFTDWWMRWSAWVWLLPLAVSALWWLLRGHARRGPLMKLLGYAGALAVDGMSVIAAFLPLIYLPEVMANG